jgi:ankyrin repeat protein
MTREWEQAIVKGDVETVGELLLQGIDPDARDDHGQTALMLAAHHGHGAIVEMLIVARAALDTVAKFHLSAAMLAIVAGHEEIARVLVRAGANLHIRGSGAPGFAGRTAHDLAVARGMDRLAEEIARAEADSA